MKKTRLKEVVECRDCMDEKKCNHCRGSGSISGYDSARNHHQHECEDCGGSGVCQWCNEDEKK